MFPSQDRPVVSATRIEETSVQNLEFRHCNGEQPRQRRPLDQYHSGLRGHNECQRPEVEHGLQNNHNVAMLIQQSRISQQLVGHLHPRSLYRARRTSQMVNGVLYKNAAVSTTNKFASDWPLMAHGAEFGDQSEHFFLAGSRSEDGTHPSLLPRREPLYRHTATLNTLQGVVHGSTKETASQPRLSRGPPRPLPDRMFLEQNAQYPPLLQNFDSTQPIMFVSDTKQERSRGIEVNRTPVYELAGSISQPKFQPPMPIDVTGPSGSSYAIRRGTSDQLKLLEDFRDESPAPAETTIGTTLSPITVEQQTATPLYEYYTGMRTWEFEDVTDAYSKIMNGSCAPQSSPPARHSGGLEWFYGGRTR